METTRQATIKDIAEQFDRIYPSQIDQTISANGRQEAGHIGHDEYDDDGNLACVGWFCAGGNSGDPVCIIKTADIGAVHEILIGIPDGDDRSLESLGINHLVKWMV